MKKLSTLGKLIGALLLCATPVSLHWSPTKAPQLSVDGAQARIGRPLTPMSIAGVNRRMNRRAYYGGYGGYYRPGIGVGIGAAAVGAAALGTAAAYHNYYGYAPAYPNNYYDYSNNGYSDAGYYAAAPSAYDTGHYAAAPGYSNTGYYAAAPGYSATGYYAAAPGYTYGGHVLGCGIGNWRCNTAAGAYAPGYSNAGYYATAPSAYDTGYYAAAPGYTYGGHVLGCGIGNWRC